MIENCWPESELQTRSTKNRLNAPPEPLKWLVQFLNRVTIR